MNAGQASAAEKELIIKRIAFASESLRMKHRLLLCMIQCSNGIGESPLKLKIRVFDESSVKGIMLYHRPTRQTIEHSLMEMETVGEYLVMAPIPGRPLVLNSTLSFF